jgi:hypothetical protein
MARKQRTKRPTRKVARTATATKLVPVASDVWLEIGEVWLERNPKDIRELIVKERHVRRMR